MPIYEGRKPGTLRIVVWARGKPHEETWGDAKDKTGAKDREAQMRLELRARSRSTHGTAVRFSKFCAEEYAPHARARLGANTWRCRAFILATLNEAFGDVPLADFTTEAIDEYATARVAQGHSPSYINGDLTVLRAILYWARDDRRKLVGDFKVRMLPTDERRVEVWTEEQVDCLLETSRIEDKELEDVLLYLLNTGCRKGESVAAEWSWVDERAGMLRIPVNDYWKPKSKRPRDVPLSDALWAMLRRRVRTTRWIFPNRLGRRHKGFMDPRFRHVRDTAGLTGGPHTTRHTFASHFLQKVPDLGLLATVLGHSRTRTTELYAHLLPGHLEGARNAVNFGGARQDHGETMAKRRAS